MIISFDKDIHQLSALTNDRRVLEAAIKRTAVSKYFGTLLNDAVLETSKAFLHSVTGRKAIILLTDGEDGGSQVDAKELLAYESEVDARSSDLLRFFMPGAADSHPDCAAFWSVRSTESPEEEPRGGRVA